MEAVVIGASAGGPAALRTLVSQLDPALKVAIVVVNHVSADGPDLLAEILARSATLPVVLAQERQPVRPGTIHVAPAGYHLLIEHDRHFALSAEEKVLFSRPSIDVLFTSAADAYGNQVIGVLLTGASADGAQGLYRIHEAGGATLVQDPAEAEVPTMPLAALARTDAHIRAPLRGLADHINRRCARS